jgi:hypothetical protein
MLELDVWDGAFGAAIRAFAESRTDGREEIFLRWQSDRSG